LSHRYRLSPNTELVFTAGDLTHYEGDAIVNAANEWMLGGGGVDGAIHRAAGPDLLDACKAVPEATIGIRCPTGEARITPAFGRLLVKHVIHAVGPRYRDPLISAPLLTGAYRNSLLLANRHGLSKVAFPAISCGVYRYPLDEAADIAVATCLAHHGGLREVAFVFFDPEAAQAWFEAATRAGLRPDS
jgi:O-acetyl-ADP-ribose deacetylase (regulator of RNase III)